ncbi:MAG: hypothetical protein HGA85_04385 [Nanoarchaeota archaeon]|nr:hypothetical protein [Nanoarchaeota archaeon]
MSQLIDIAIQYLGYPSVPYTKPGEGRTPDGFTCAGFVHFVLGEAGLSIPDYHTYELFDRFGILVHDGLQKPGDLAFESKYGFKPTHVEFYVDIDTLTELMDDYGSRIQKDLINDFVSATSAREFMIGSHGKAGSKVMLTELVRTSITPDPKFSHLPQLYNVNPIGFKRPAVLLPGKKYQEIFS